MTEPEEPNPPEVVKVARDLTEILNLVGHDGRQLLTQAVHRANDHAIPGGHAMVTLGPDASPDEWAEQIEAAEHRHYAKCPKASHTDCTVLGTEHVEDEDDSWEPPLQTLLYWTEELRIKHGHKYDGWRPTIDTEAGYLRNMLEHLWATTEPRWADMAADVNAARVRLENVLCVGVRSEWTRVPCNNPDCEGLRLAKVYGATAAQDRYQCLRCEKMYDQGDYEDAYAAQLRSEGAERYVPLADAIAILAVFGRTERIVRYWLAPDAQPTVDRYRDPDTGRSWVWWPALWRRHRETPTRKRRHDAA